MRKLAITIFAVLYVSLIVAGSAGRTTVWAVRQAEATAHPELHHQSNGFSKTETSDTHLYQTKLIEHCFVVELPRESVEVSLGCEHYSPLSSYEDQIAQSGQRISSRAPPAHT